MKRILLYLYALTMLSSCNDWLDVQPEASVSAEKLFASEEGFYEAINGIYTRCADNMLYGGLFTCELQDVMMQNYSFRVQDYTTYQKTSIFDFMDPTFRWRVNTVWEISYGAIANCNLLLQYIDGKKNVLGDGMYELVKGEALALRAYLHFDILRMFAKPYSQANAQLKFIPYVTAYTNKVTPLSTMDEVLKMAEDDLTEAKRLLKTSDPIVKQDYVTGYIDEKETTEQKNPNLFLQNRRHRMNYYAVCGTLARVQLYMQKKPDALSNALEVINSAKFKWVNPEIFLADYTTAERDRIMYPELMFAWYIETRESNMNNRYNNVTTGYFINTDYLNSIYEIETIGGEDYRYKGWFTLSSSNNNNSQIIKYLRNPVSTGNRHYLVAPAVRLSEMYYIAAECSADPEYLNIVRRRRGIGAEIGAGNNLEDELLKEYRKETYAEGQAFFAYKRLNRSIRSESGIIYEPSTIYGGIQLPENEIEFGKR